MSAGKTAGLWRIVFALHGPVFSEDGQLQRRLALDGLTKVRRCQGVCLVAGPMERHIQQGGLCLKVLPADGRLLCNVLRQQTVKRTE